MARDLDPNQPVAPEVAAAIAGAPRARAGTRENDARNKRMARKRRDKFYVPPELIPAGWVVEWKRKSVLGKIEEADYEMDLAEGGWKRAKPDKFPGLVPDGYQGDTVERGGMILMLRPKHMKDEALKLDKEEAMNQVRDKLSEVGMTGQGELPRRVQSFHREYDRPAGRVIPDDDDSGDNA